MQLKQREKRGPLILFTQYPVRMTANWMAGVFDFRGSGVGGKWGLHGAAIFFCQLPFLCSFCEPFFIVCSSGFLVFFFACYSLALKMFYVVCDLSNLLCTCSGGVGGLRGVTRDLIGGALFCYIFYIHIYICMPEKDVRLVCLRRKA